MIEINKLYHDDCFNIMRGMPDSFVDLVLTDVPYEQVSKKSNGLRVINKGAADILEFDLKDFLAELNRICRGSIYVFCASEQVSLIRSTMVDLKLSTRHCIWEKTNPSPMNGQYIWLSSIENCIYGKKSKSTFNEHCKSSVWRFPNGRSKVHPTEKPLKLFEYLVNVSSNEGDIVFDPCAGHATTCVAATNLNRNFIGVEKNLDYYNDASERLLLTCKKTN